MSNEQQANQWCQALYEQKAAGLILYGRALGLSHGEAEDVLQETFMALLQMPEPPSEPLNYCLRCYRNRVLNYRRSLWRRLTRELESYSWFEPSPGETDAQEQAVKCLSQLPPEQREVIVLKIWNEYTFDAIGRLLDISPNTVAGRYRYGMDKLKTLLKGLDYEQSRRIGKTITVLDPATRLG